MGEGWDEDMVRVISVNWLILGQFAAKKALSKSPLAQPGQGLFKGCFFVAQENRARRKQCFADNEPMRIGWCIPGSLSPAFGPCAWPGSRQSVG
jgi:hypothetical protein